jgi:23S rRNA (uracil1939-C5)-methyltransferase
MNVGDILLLTIDDLALPDGYGVARYDGRVVFVPGAFPGDVVRVRVGRVEKRAAYGEMVDLEQPSVDRIPVECDRMGWCGGCELQGLDYGRQLEIKQNHLHQVLRRIGDIDPDSFPIFPIVPSVEPYFYRSKIEFAFREQEGETTVGLTERISPFRPFEGRVEEIGDCRLFSPVAASILPLVRNFVANGGMIAYDPATGKGSLSRLVLREGKETKEVMVNVVAESASDAFLDLGRELSETVPEIKSIYITRQRHSRLLLGRAYITERLGPLVLRVYPQSFFQPNPRTAAKLYSAIAPLAGFAGTENLLGLYCGAGSLELYLAPLVKSVMGVDSNGFSIACANENAVINGIKNVTFVKAKAESVKGRAGTNRPDAVLIDPPRAGMTREAITAVRQIRAKKVIYISCNPSTLARDLKILDPDYRPIKMIPFDFFPHTGHFEVLALLERK